MVDRDDGAKRRMWTLLVAGACVVALTAGLLIFWGSGDDAPEHEAAPTTAALPTTPAPVPEDPTRERWRWGGKPIVKAMAAGVGVVATTTDGRIIGVDGRTGRQLWQRQNGKNLLDEPVIPNFEAAPDRRTALVWSGDVASGTQLRALDAFTGRLVWEADDNVVFRGLAATTSTVILGEVTETFGSAAALRALALDTGQEAWRYAPPAGCEIASVPVALTASGDTVIAASADTVFVQTYCPAATGEASAGVVALDAASGAELWRRHLAEVPLSRAAQPIGGGALALAGVGGPEGRTVFLTTAVDQRTGQDLGPAVPEIDDVEAVVPDSLEVVTEAGIHRVGDAAPRWQFPAEAPELRTAAVQFGRLVARFADRCGGKAYGSHVAFYELDTGARRRSLGCFASPAEGDPGLVIPAPGAIVVLKDDNLLGYA